MFKKLCLWSCLSWFAIGCATSEPIEAPDPQERALPVLQREDPEAALCGADEGVVEEDLAAEVPQREAAEPDLGTQATCTARCGAFPDVSCSASTCGSAVDQNCATGVRGYAECNGVRTYCQACACVEGEIRYRTGSGCCCNYDDPEAPKARGLLLIDKCINGAWVYQGGVCDGANCGGICPV
jgi:hypothetical protein